MSKHSARFWVAWHSGVKLCPYTLRFIIALLAFFKFSNLGA